MHSSRVGLPLVVILIAMMTQPVASDKCSEADIDERGRCPAKPAPKPPKPKHQGKSTAGSTQRAGEPNSSDIQPTDIETTNEPDVKRLADVLKHPVPMIGLEKAKVGAPRWCNAAKYPKLSLAQINNYDHIAQGFEQYESHYQWAWGLLLEIAANLCVADPQNLTIQQATAEVAQLWINITGLSEKDAIASIAARLDEDNFSAGKQKLCETLEPPAEWEGEDLVFMNTRQELFGCADNNTLWLRIGSTPGSLINYLDQSANEPDELIRLAYVVIAAELGFSERTDFFEQELVWYAIRNIDFKLLSDDKISRLLATKPYAGNSYATTIVRESLGRARLGIKLLEVEVQKRASDADWKELLFDAPTRGANAYLAEAAKYKDQIARSNQIERKLFAPSKKAVSGCQVDLRKDLLAVWKSVKHATTSTVEKSLSHPVVSLLFERFAACMAVDGNPQYADRLYSSMPKYVRGPRQAACRMMVQAATRIHADRARFPIKPEDFHECWSHGFLSDVTNHAKSQYDREHTSIGFVSHINEEGVVTSAVKGKQGLVVTFVSKTSDDTPSSVIIPFEFTDNITAGKIIEIEITYDRNRFGFPVAVYADGTKNQLVNWHGFGF